MKIGIITYHRALNYGAALQAYALRTALNALGNDAEIIDYHCPRIENDYYKIISSDSHAPKTMLKSIIKYPYKHSRSKRFREFEKLNNHLSREKYYPDNVIQANDIYDAFISGSDQIWNHRGSGFDKNYFLEFASDDKKKIAYSASFGYTCVPAELRDEYTNLLNQYDSISMRESSGSSMIKNLIGCDAPVTCDPVMLMKESKWRAIEKAPDFKIKYLLCYFLSPNSSYYNRAIEIAKEQNLKVYAIGVNQKKYDGVKMLFNVSLDAFIGLFDHADFVMTDSFHGTVFSITFNKQFTSIIPKSSTVNSRIINLLGMLDMQNRTTDDLQKCDVSEFDYSGVNKKIQQFREQSLQYLTIALGGK